MEEYHSWKVDDCPSGIEVHRGTYIRSGSYDRNIVNEINACYGWMEPAGQRVLDIGGCFGGYARLAHYQGATEVHCYEPDAANYRMTQLNCAGLEGVYTHNAALVAGNESSRKFYRTKGRNNGNYSLTEFRGREVVEVACVNFSQAIESISPEVIKMDCEGAEYELLSQSLPSCVRKITMEIHLNKKSWRQQKAGKICSLFTGWKVHKQPKIGLKNWHTIGAWYR